ncbi:N-acetyltransferase [Bacillus salacetis]|uniref:N-acetyltransferase n=1 Tax=Bacillus salacetis TaxID=2315464 RepID=A0A3A1R4I0_9BACI|nr:GNAT family protein [Bacillus salacetis]RIW37267.1 N-acetyltransferase [Bacillus salacetis]
MKKISGDRIILRELRESDWQDIHDYASQEKASRFQEWGPNTEEETKRFLSVALEDAVASPRSRFILGITIQTDSRLIGAAEINIRDFHNQSGEIGYIINPEYWGMGFAAEAAGLMIGFGFKELKLHRIYAKCHPDNEASIRVMEKSGMQREGTLRDHLKINDGWRDSRLYSILENEWAGI